MVVILVDDMGFSDIGCYGSEIPTPNLDALAANGLRFTQFYDAGRCCPTRAALLTGLYSHQAGVGHMVEDQGAPGYRGRLMPNAVTFAQVLAGYFTAMAGKWHVGMENGAAPWERGFDRSLNAAAGGFYYPDSSRAKLFLNGEALANDDARLPKNWYSTDLWTTFGLKFIDEAVTAKTIRPLFAAQRAAFRLAGPGRGHCPLPGCLSGGSDALRQRRFERQNSWAFSGPTPWPPLVQPTFRPGTRWIKKRKIDSITSWPYMRRWCQAHGPGHRRSRWLDSSSVAFLIRHSSCS